MRFITVGLTGQTGAGKGRVAQYLEKNGAYIIDCDCVAREITEPGSPVLPKLAERFGADIIKADGSLDRKLLASRAFSNAENSQALNDITHPAITDLARQEIADACSKGFFAAVLDAPVLFASPLKDDCDIIVCVCAPKAERIERLKLRDNISVSEIERRMSAQPDEEYYRNNSDIIINNGSNDDLDSQCRRLLTALQTM